MLLPAFFYICWDMLFTRLGVWHFNAVFISGIRLYNLPVEEILFFFVVPFCCTFIYACIRAYFPALKDGKTASYIFVGLAFILFTAGILFFDKKYTGFTFVFTAAFITVVLLLRSYFRHFHIAAFLISFLIILLPFLIVNGFLTAMPVVIYNDAENLAVRIYTIPLEDIFYGMLLVMMNITGYERLRNRKKANQ